MGNKIYVKETKHKNADGDYLIRVKTYKSMPAKPFYVVWA